MTRAIRGVFVVGTDTGVGKTTVAAGLAWLLRRRGIDVGVMKPVETGVTSERASDAAKLRRAAGVDDAIEEIRPYRFRAPLAPAIAARRGRTRISLTALTRAYKRLANRHDVMVVEGAGGLMVPLAHGKTTLDLAEALNLPLLLVIGNRLGAINHALLTVEAARTRRLRIIGGVINHFCRGRDAAVRTNPRALQELVSCPRWATVPYVDAAESVWKTVAKRLDKTGFVEDLLKRATR